MKLLVAEDDSFFRKTLQHLLGPDFDLCLAEDGIRAWEQLIADDPPSMAILDWVMPGLSGPQICRQARSNPRTAATYMILLTAKNSIPDIVAGLRSGADDYLTKPFDAEELRARLRVGQRVIELQSALENQARALHDSLGREAFLQKLLPVCPACGARRTDSQYWVEVESYIHKCNLHAGTCPHCAGERPADSRATPAAAGVER